MLMTVDDYLRLPQVPATHRLRYGRHPSQFCDLYLSGAAARPRPIVIVVHGGCWREKYDLAPMSGLCAALAGEGLAVWSLEYRRLGAGGGWPATFEDVAAGADFLRAIAGAYALDLSRVLALGHSAGGHLALWLAGRRRLPAESPLASPDPLPVRGVVSLAGIADLIEGERRGLCGGACREIVGGSPDEVPERYRQASPMALLPLDVPHRHIVGEEDTLVPADYVRHCAAMAERHDDARLEVLAGVGHFELVVPRPPAWDTVLATVLALLERRAGPE